MLNVVNTLYYVTTALRYWESESESSDCTIHCGSDVVQSYNPDYKMIRSSNVSLLRYLTYVYCVVNTVL